MRKQDQPRSDKITSFLPHCSTVSCDQCGHHRAIAVVAASAVTCARRRPLIRERSGWARKAPSVSGREGRDGLSKQDGSNDANGAQDNGGSGPSSANYGRGES